MKYDDEETLRQGKATILQETSRDEMVRSLTSLFGQMTVHGYFRMPESNRQNNKFPDLKLKRVDEMIKEVWVGR